MTSHLPFPLLSRNRLRLFSLHLLALVFAAGFVLGTARAQSTGETDPIDPPGRVGSISLMAGPVTLTDLQTGSREEAALNWPITAGWRLDTGRMGRAEVRIGSTALRLDDETTVDFARLDDHFIQIAVLRGSVALRVRNSEVVSELEVLTQREQIVFDDVGRYRIDVDQLPGHTAVTAFAGRARIASAGSSFVVASGQRGELSAPPLVRFQLAAAAADRFDDWVAARDTRDDAIRSASYVSRETTGVEMLDDYGDWRTVNDYGTVWFPRTVPSGWAPYRYGRWASVDPWGWTWVDEAPWGFAPFHYGRWVVVGGAWGWVPGVIVPRPVYAPALVAWFGAPGISVSIGAPIGWFPLGPREVYVPAYRYSPRYLRVVNVQHVPNVERVTIVQTPRYVHRQRDRSTWLPGDRFGRSDPVHRDVRPPPSEWRQYIARPQPPANVPNTKRRQHNEIAAPLPTARPPVTPVLTAPTVRQPRAIPRAVEAPPAAAAPAPDIAPREPRGRGELPASRREERRYAPRAPSSAVQPQAPPHPAVAPAEPARSREIVPAPRRPAVVESPAHRSRGEIGAVRRDQQRHSPRAPAPSAPALPAQIPAAQASPPSRTAAPERAERRQPVPQRPPEVRADDSNFDRPSSRSPREAMR